MFVFVLNVLTTGLLAQNPISQSSSRFAGINKGSLVGASSKPVYVYNSEISSQKGQRAKAKKMREAEQFSLAHLAGAGMTFP